MSPEESREILELADTLQALVIAMVSDAMNDRDPLPTALAVQAKMDELRRVAKSACKYTSDPST